MIWSLLVTMTARAQGILKADDYKHYVDRFNADDDEPYKQTIPNAQSWDFLRGDVPLFNCPDTDFERTYYFRWWTYRKHLLKTQGGWVVTEFMPPVSWAGKDNTISCAAWHHLNEGRWLRDGSVADDYLKFWLRGGGNLRAYSFPVADAAWAVYKVRHHWKTTGDLLPELVDNYHKWDDGHRDDGRLFWQTDTADGMEVSVGGHGYRPTINSYMYADARAIAGIARLTGDDATAAAFDADADKTRALVQKRLWSDKTHFFHTVNRAVSHKVRADQPVVDPTARELVGYVPWVFDLPDKDRGYEIAWAQLNDPDGFAGKFGPTTAERRSKLYRVSYAGHECQWCGPSWPFATSQTLVGLANVIRDYPQAVVSRTDYFQLLSTYTHSQTLPLPSGKVIPWIDEDLDPDTGVWIARKLLTDRREKPPQRGKDYNHSTYCDLIITGLCGLVPSADDTAHVDPLLPRDTWDWFCLQDVPYHDRLVTIVWDRDGTHYNRGVGLSVFIDGLLAGNADHMAALDVPLPMRRRSEGERGGGGEGERKP